MSVNRVGIRGANSAITDRRMAGAATLFVWFCLIIAYRDQVALILEAWETLPSHAHGYVVLAVVAYLAWEKRKALGGVPLTPSWLGLGAFLLSCAAGFAGEMVSAGVVVQFALVFMLQSAVWAVMGTRAFRVLFGPLCFLLFAIPFGHDVLPTLMDWTADATVLGLRASGVPVFQENRMFIIPSGHWSVVEACSGIRYLLTAFFIGSIYAYITYSRWYKRLLFVLWILLLSLIANWLRAYVIVMVAHVSNNQWGLGLSHLALGWVIFAVTIFASFWIGRFWTDPQQDVATPPRAAAAPSGRSLGVAALAAMVGIGSSLASGYLLHAAPHSTPVLDLSKSLAGLQPVAPSYPMVVPKFVGPSAVHEGTYQHEDGEIGLTVAYYRNQKQGAELANVNNRIEPTREWTWNRSYRMASSGDGIPEMRVEQYGKGTAHAVVATVYWVGGWTTNSDVVSKFYQAINLILGNGDDGAMIVVSATSIQNAEPAEARVISFVRDRLPALLADLSAVQLREGKE